MKKEGCSSTQSFHIINKREILLVFFSIFLLLSLVSISAVAGGISANAVDDQVDPSNSEVCGVLKLSDCNTEDGVILFRLSNYINAHVEIATNDNYDPYVFCCSNSYEVTNINENNELLSPSICTGENKLIGLYSESNSHAEAPSEYFYPDYPICYGDIECQAGYKDGFSRVLSLSDLTDAHIAYPSYYDNDLYCNVDYWTEYGYCGDGVKQSLNYFTGLPEQCDDGENNGLEASNCTEECTDKGTTAVMDFHWAETDSTMAEFSYKIIVVGRDTVYMRAENIDGIEGVNQGDPIKFEIWEHDGGADDKIRHDDNENKAIDGTWSNNDVYASWTINNEDLEKTSGDYTEFYFKTLDASGNVLGESNYLELKISSVFNCNLVSMCQDYLEDGCGDDPCDVADDDIGAKNSDVTCGVDGYNCFCYWDESRGVCDSSWGNNDGNCTYSSNIDDNCDDGFLHYTFDATWVPKVEGGPESDPNCIPGQTTIPCPAEIKLTGWDVFNIILVVALLALIYWAIMLKKKEKGKGGSPKAVAHSKKNKAEKTKTKKSKKKSSKKSSSKKSKKKK